jgi:hypothetical protein
MSVNRIRVKIIVENQRVGTVNLRGDGPSQAVIPAIRTCDQIAPIFGSATTPRRGTEGRG